MHYIFNNIAYRGHMIIFVNTFWRRSIELDVESADSIKSIKNKIFEILCISQYFQRLIFERKFMKDISSLSDYNIESGATIYVIAHIGYAYISQFTTTNDDLIVEINIKASVTSSVEDIKYQIQDKTGYPIESIHLYYKYEELSDDEILLDRINFNLLSYIKFYQSLNLFCYKN